MLRSTLITIVGAILISASSPSAQTASAPAEQVFALASAQAWALVVTLGAVASRA